MPETEYQWTDSGVNAIATDESMELNLKKITAFTKTLGMPFLSSGIIKKLYENDIRNIERSYFHFKRKTAFNGRNTAENGQQIIRIYKFCTDKPQPLEKIMTASLCFGHGFARKS